MDEHDPTPCKYGDPYCPCQDGDACHYEWAKDGTGPMRPPDAWFESSHAGR